TGTPGSAIFSMLNGTLALRKYFCARISTATWDQASGTWMSFISKTMDPSGFTMREPRWENLMDAKESCPAAVKRRGMCMVSYLRVYGITTSVITFAASLSERRLDTVHPNRYSLGKQTYTGPRRKFFVRDGACYSSYEL